MTDNWETADAETLGQLVIESAEKIRITKTSSAIMHLAANLLLTIAYETNATEVTIAQDGCTYKGQLTGDWIIEVKRINGPEHETCKWCGGPKELPDGRNCDYLSLR